MLGAGLCSAEQETEILECVQKRTAKVIGGLQHLSYEERLREPGLFNGSRKVQGVLLSVDLMGVKKTEPKTFQWCPVVEQEAKNTN